MVHSFVTKVAITLRVMIELASNELQQDVTATYSAPIGHGCRRPESDGDSRRITAAAGCGGKLTYLSLPFPPCSI